MIFNIINTCHTHEFVEGKGIDSVRKLQSRQYTPGKSKSVQKYPKVSANLRNVFIFLEYDGNLPTSIERLFYKINLAVLV